MGVRACVAFCLRPKLMKNAEYGHCIARLADRGFLTVCGVPADCGVRDQKRGSLKPRRIWGNLGTRVSRPLGPLDHWIYVGPNT